MTDSKSRSPRITMDERLWPSCGHTSTSVCRECYHERGNTISELEAEIKRLNRLLARMNKGLKLLSDPGAANGFLRQIEEAVAKGLGW